MQREFPSIDFATQAEVRLEAEHRRTEEVAGLFVALPQRAVLGVHRRLAGQTPAVLGLEHIEDELLLGPEVIMQLAQGDTGRVLTRRPPSWQWAGPRRRGPGRRSGRSPGARAVP